MKNPVDEYFKKDLESIEIKPSADLWKNKIEPQIEAKRKKPVIWYRAAAVIILLMSSWFVVVNFQPKKDQVHTIKFNQPVVLEPVEVTPTDVTAKIYQPVDENLVVEMNIPAPKKANQIPQQKVSSKNAEQIPAPQQQAENVIAENQEMETPKRKISVQLKIDPVKLASSVSSQSGAEPKEEPTVGEYAKNQWENIKQGEKLNAPPKKWFALPKVKVEGNPLRGVLAAREE